MWHWRSHLNSVKFYNVLICKWDYTWGQNGTHSEITHYPAPSKCSIHVSDLILAYKLHASSISVPLRTSKLPSLWKCFTNICWVNTEWTHAHIFMLRRTRQQGRNNSKGKLYGVVMWSLKCQVSGALPLSQMRQKAAPTGYSQTQKLMLERKRWGYILIP